MGTCYQSEQLKGLVFCKIILKKKMRNFVAFLAIGIMVCQALPQDMPLNRQKKELLPALWMGMVPAEYFAILSKVLETVFASTINQMEKMNVTVPIQRLVEGV